MLFRLGLQIAPPASVPPLAQTVGILLLTLDADPSIAGGTRRDATGTRATVPNNADVRVLVTAGDSERTGSDGQPAPVDEVTVRVWVEGRDDPAGPGRLAVATNVPGQSAVTLPAGVLPSDVATGVRAVAQMGTAQQTSARIVLVATSRAG